MTHKDELRRIERLRNIGVLAHVDAGKTTLTERMLFAAGRIHRMGEVHEGASAMDYREIERRHGVTVSAAATSVEWRDHRVAILDTPGHVDFTQEVERALLAIDGAVVLFSGVAGVEPQTETVWRQADRFALPRIGFVNKMDAVGADFDHVIASMRRRLGARPIAAHWPVRDADGLSGVVDLVAAQWLVWSSGRDLDDPRAVLTPIVGPIPDALAAEAERRRAALIEALLDAAPEADDAIVEAYLEGRGVTPAQISALLRQVCLARAATPVLAGAAYRGVGVSTLLDAIVAWAPSPLDRGATHGRDPATGGAIERAPAPEAPASALVSKVAVTRFGPIATARVMSGRLTRDSRLVNAATGEAERIGRVLAVHAGETAEIDGAGPGDIVALAGLKGVRAGDTLADPRAPIVFAGLERAEPVIEAAIEGVSAADHQRLGAALAALAREDPSLKVSTDPETGELLIAGMGELHLQIALEALAEERGVAARIGPPRIAYRETIERPAEVAHTLRKQTGGPGQFARLVLRIEPSGGTEPALTFENRSVGGAVPTEFVPAVEAALQGALSEGGLAGYPVVGVRAILLDGAHHPTDSSSLAFANAARAAFREAYDQAAPRLLEPLARVEIRTPEEHVGGVISDLQARRGAVAGVEPGLESCGVSAEAPLANLWGYVGALRSLTRGRGQASVSFARYAPAPNAVLETVQREIGV